MGRRAWAIATAGLLAAGGLALTPGTSAAPSPGPKPYKEGGNRALGSGLGRLIEESSGAQAKSLRGSGKVRLNQSKLAMRDAQGRVMVQLTPQQGVDRAAFRRQAEAQGLVVKGVDSSSGTLEGFVPLAKAPVLAGLRGTGTLAQSIRPTTNIGKATSQGVALQRADKVQAGGTTGKGITVGALSDSYDAATTYVTGEPLDVRAKQDVASGDLPGNGDAQHPTPVANLDEIDDPTNASDEGRAMLQIIHDVAPSAKLCFASAFNGEIAFADNIRKLADPNGKCKADVVVDDVNYFSEPMFSDGIIGDAIDDVAKKGVQYYSSVGNSGNAQSWESDARLLPARQALRGTNLDFSEVDPSLYSGGLQDLDPTSGTDVAQSIAVGPGGGLFNLQWDDPVDLNGATYGAPVFQRTGELTKATPQVSYTYTPAAAQVGQLVEFRTDAIPSGSTDLILSVDAPDGRNLGTIDTGSSPEVLATKLTQSGPYTITVSGFQNATGDFTVQVRPVVSPSKVTTDYNVLLFDPEGGYIGAVADLNPATGRPQELGFLDGLDALGEVQLVIARSGTGPVKARKLRNILNGDVYFTELNDSLAPATFGHATAKGATAVGAYDPFAPFLPESFTSPGGDLKVYFDSAGNRYPTPQTRRKPEVSGADGGNTTFFTNDSLLDPDTQRNFFGTSASAPHVAAIAALVLEKQGGPRSLTPTQMRQRLQRSTFPHDLDPNRSGGTAGGVSVSAEGAQGNENRVVPGSMNDPRFFTVRNTGPTAVRSITFFGETASPTALGIRTPGKSDGIVFDPRPFGETPFRDNGFPFTVGSTSGGLGRKQVAATFSVPNGGASAPRQYRRMTLTFKKGLKQDQGLQFGIDRDLAASGYGGSNEGNGADELGGAVFLPSGKAVSRGMKFVATLANGRTVTGYFSNRLGSGYTPLDGYGLVNAEKAVLGR